MSGTYWGILSLSLAEIVRIIALNERWLTGGANGITVIYTAPHLPWIVLGSRSRPRCSCISSSPRRLVARSA